MRVRIYWNLHKRCFSVQTKWPQGWRVDAHVDSITLLRATFHVSAAGQERVRREGKKNVHALIEGDLAGPYAGSLEPGWTGAVKYNPYTDEGFHDEAGVPWEQSTMVVAWTVPVDNGARRIPLVRAARS